MWQVLAFLVNFWVVVDDCGWLLEAMDDCGRLWILVGGSRWLWVVAYFSIIRTKMGLKELNWFCKHMKKVRRSQPCISWIFVPNSSSTSSSIWVSLILSGSPLTYFYLVETPLSAFLWLYTLVCAFVQKYQEMPFISNYSHFYTVHLNKQNQNKNYTTSCHIQIDHAFYCSI